MGKKLKGLRHPKTTPERRASADPDSGEYVRTKRKAQNLPSLYDDKQIPTDKESPKKRVRSRSDFRDTIRKG